MVAYSYRARMPIPRLTDPFFGFWEGGGRKTPGQLSPSAPARYRGNGEDVRPGSSSFPIFLRATVPQVQSPDTGEGSGCGRFSVYLATQCAVLESKADMQKRG
jgi:hypothetical protein